MDAITEKALPHDPALTRERLRDLLAARVNAAPTIARSETIPIREQGEGPLLLCVLGGGAGLPSYKRLAEHLGGLRIVGLQIVGAVAEDPVIRSIECMADLHLAAIRESRLQGPFILCGHSLAATIALELAQRLGHTGERVSLVILIDQPGPDARLTKKDWLYWQWASISHLPWRQRWNYVTNGIRYQFATSRWLPDVVRRLFFPNKCAPGTNGIGGYSAAEYRRRMTDATLEALQTYRPRPYKEPIALLRARSGSSRIHCDANGGWGSVAAGGIRVLEVPGHHMNIFNMPNLSKLADILAAICRETVSA